MAGPGERESNIDRIIREAEERAASARATRTAQGVPLSTAPPTTVPKKEAEVVRTTEKEASALFQLESEEDKLRQQLRDSILQSPQGLLLAPEEVERQVEEQMRSRLGDQPAYLGSFAGPVVPYVAGLPAMPMNLPGPVPTLGTALSPQTRAPEIQATREMDNPFDDLEFEKSIGNLSPEDKVLERNKYRAFKRAFEKVRELNPDESVGSIIADVERQLNELPAAFRGEKGLITQDPARELGIAAQPLARALSEQTTTGQVPRLEPGQLAFLQGMYEAELPQSQEQARASLSRPGAKPIMETRQRPSGERGPGGRPIMESYQVQVGSTDYTAEEIEQIIRDRTAAGTYDARPWWANAEEREKILANPEKYAKGGIIFQKEYPTGAVVESPVSWAVRAAMSPINMMAGAAGYLFTEEGIQSAKESDRPELYKGEGMSANVIYNVATGGGFTKEIGDLYEYNPNPTVREYKWLGQAAGLGADLLSLGDLAVMSGVAKGGAAAAQTARLAKLAGETTADAARAAVRAGGRGAAAGYLDAVPGFGKLAEKVQPGDVRVIYGAKVADEYKAATRYLDETAKGATHEEAVRVVENEYGGTKFARDAAKRTEALTEVDVTKYLGKASEEGLSNTRSVSKAADEVLDAGRAGTKADEASERIVRPYLQAAARSDPRIRAAIASVFEGVPGGTKVTAATIIQKLSEGAPESAQRFVDAIKTVAAFESGVKTMDTALAGAFSKGAPTVFLTEKTITTPKFAAEIIADYKRGEFFNDVVIPLQEGATKPFRSGNQVVDAFSVTDDAQKSIIKSTISQARASGAIPEIEATRILSDVDNGFIAASDLRSLTYSEIDAIATGTQRGFGNRGLAEVSKPKGIPAGTTRARTVAQEQRAAELKSNLPVYAKRAKDGIMNSIRGRTNELSNVQRQMINEARGKVSALDRVLRDEYTRISTEPEFAALYGITTDASPEVKLIALGQGPIGGGGGQVWAEQFLEGLIFGAEKNKLQNAFRPEFKFGESILRNTEEWNRLVDDVAQMDATTVSQNLENIFDRARRIVETDVSVKLKDLGGFSMSVPSKLSTEALSVGWARTKANSIVAETAAKILPERPIGLATETKWWLSLPANDKSLGTKVFYALVEEEARNPGFLGRLAENASANRSSIDRLAADIVRRVAPGLEGARSSSLQNLIRLEFNTADPAVTGLLDDVIGQVDIAKSYGLIENNNPEDFIERLGALISKKIGPESLVMPFAAEEIMRIVGSEAKYKQAVTALAREAQAAADGNVSAIGASRIIRSMIDSYNSFYYYAMLSLSPRFHGVNNLTAPLITYYTTGRAANPLKFGEAANVILLGSPKNLATRINRDVVIVTDRFGNNYTRGMLFDLAMKRGIFKSQINTEVAADFINVANEIVGNIGAIEKGRRAVFTAPKAFLGDPLAAFTDNVWRMTAIIDSIKSGRTIEEALDVGRRSLFDYGNLTEPERFISRNFFVFYNYFRQSIAQGVENFFAAPDRMIRLFRLSQQPSRIMLGDQNFEDLAFYFSPDAATGRMVSALEPAEQSKDGVFVQHPMMPHADALKIAAAIITDPIAFAIGPTPIGEDGRRAYSEGFIAARLGPLTKLAGALAFSDRPSQSLIEVRMKKNRIAPEHVAMWDALMPDGGRDAMLDYFNVTKQPVEGNAENAYQGYAYVVSDADFERYQNWLAVAQTTGTIRSWNDWSKIVGGAELTGAYPKTTWQQLASATGLATYSSAVLEYVTSERYLRDRARMTAKEKSEVKRAQEERRK